MAGFIPEDYYQQAVQANLTGYVRSNEEYVIRFLTSERGKELNERKCRVIGHDGKRLEVKLLGEQDAQAAGFKVMPRNLVPSKLAFVPEPGPPLPDGVVVKGLNAALRHPSITQMDRPDVSARIAFVKPHLKAGRVPPSSVCLDPMCPVPPGTTS